MATKKVNHHVIFSTEYDTDNYEESFKEWCEINDLDPEDEDIYDYINMDISEWLSCEKSNLDVECGRILAIADLGLWDGRHSAYKVIETGKVNGILSAFSFEDAEFYSDGKDIKCRQPHHDGVNYITFREIKPTATESGIRRICDMLYNGKEVPKSLLQRHTRSLCPIVNKVFGWK